MESRHIKLIDRHPDAARFDALSTGLLSCMLGLAFAFLVVGLTGASGAIALAVIGAGVAHGFATTARWIVRQRNGRVVYLRNIPAGWRGTVDQMVHDVDSIHHLMSATPSGPVLDHVCEVYLAAQNVLDRCLARAEFAGDRTSPDLDVLIDKAELRQLVEASHRLRATHQNTLTHRPLIDLTERTDRIRAALEADDLATSLDSGLAEGSS